jgi:hypothetical protein
MVEIDGHRQAQPLLGCFAIVLTLSKIFCSDIEVQCSDTGRVLFGDIIQWAWTDETILTETHFNYLTHKLFCSGDKHIHR